MSRIAELQQLVKAADGLKVSSSLINYAGVLEYYPEELVITVKSSTTIAELQTALAKHNQALPFFVKSPQQSIGAAFALGAEDLSDAVLGVKIIDGTGELLNFGGQVLKNVAGYDVSRLLVGSKGQLALVVQISFKVIPSAYAKNLKACTKSSKPPPHQQIQQKLKAVFDPKGIFQ